MQNPVSPSGIALIVCDALYQEPGGKVALVGIFGNINTPALPYTHPQMAIFASMTGLRTKATAKVDIIHGEIEAPIVGMTGEFDGVGPLNVVDMQFVLRNVVFKDEGVHFVRLWGNDHLLIQRPFNVFLMPRTERG